MKKYLYYCFCCYCLLFAIHEVNGQGAGLILEDEVYNTLPTVPMSFAVNEDAKIIQKVSLKKYCPKVVNQGAIGSCVGWSSGYAAFTIMKAKEEGWTDIEQITKEAYSALYIYNQVKIGDCYQGSLFSKALEFLKNNGNCLSRDFDYPKDDCNKTPNQKHQNAAQNNHYEVRDFFTLYASNTSNNEKVNQVKLSISEGKPVIVGMTIRENFKNLRKGDEFWYPEIGDKTAVGGHAMVVIGYDEEKEAFEVMNSWGTQWGNNGFFWIKYKDFGKYCVYGYQLLVGKKMIDNETENWDNTDEIVEKSTLNLSAEFTFRYPIDYNKVKQEAIFESAQTVYNGYYYRLSSKKGQRFQLMTKQITRDRYVYVFSIDADNESKIHWPKNGQYEKYFSGLKEGAIVPYDNVEIVIPGKDKALIKDKVGSDNLFVLYSYKPIEDLIVKIKAIQGSEGNYYQRLKMAFGKRLVPHEDIEYAISDMRFSTSSKSGGYIVPILLEVSTQ